MLKPLPTRRLFAHSVNRHAVFFICLVLKKIDLTYSLCTLFVITAQRARLLRVQKAHMTQPCPTLSTSFWQLGCLCTAFLSCLRLTYGHFLNSSLTQMNDCNINIKTIIAHTYNSDHVLLVKEWFTQKFKYRHSDKDIILCSVEHE